MDVYAIVTDKIINLLEQGVVPWRRPWTGGGLPRNVASVLSLKFVYKIWRLRREFGRQFWSR
jgi:hypothetical protein